MRSREERRQLSANFEECVAQLVSPFLGQPYTTRLAATLTATLQEGLAHFVRAYGEAPTPEPTLCLQDVRVRRVPFSFDPCRLRLMWVGGFTHGARYPVREGDHTTLVPLGYDGAADLYLAVDGRDEPMYLLRRDGLDPCHRESFLCTYLPLHPAHSAPLYDDYPWVTTAFQRAQLLGWLIPDEERGYELKLPQWH